MEKKSIIIKSPINIHSQISAMIVRKVNEICKRYNVKIYIRKVGSSRLFPANSMLSMVTFFASKNEDIEIIIEGSSCDLAMEEIKKFFIEEVKLERDENSTYELLKNTSIAYEEIFNSIASGLIVTDENSIITVFNKAAEKLTGMYLDKMIGKTLRDVIPELAVNDVLKNGKEIFNKKVNIGDKTLFVNITPILASGTISGSVLILQDIPEIEYLEGELNRNKRFDKAFDIIIGNSGKLKDALTVASKAAETDSNVIVRGESGTGKELVANAIHYSSKRKNKPFIRVNCAAIPSTLLESELFGHERGAFTGAVTQKIGKFELADGGSIFLDEIGDIPIETQVKLLRVIQDKEFERVGGIKTIKVDVRIIAATNKNLEEAIKNGTFREDLYYRLNVIPIFLPPLRDRREDIPILADSFIKKINKKLNKNVKFITNNAIRTLMHYDWPGNIRELENIIERCITLCDGDYIDFDDLPSYVKNEKERVQEDIIYLGKDYNLEKMEDYEYKIIKAALIKYKSFNKTGKALGLTHKTIASKARKFHLVES